MRAFEGLSAHEPAPADPRVTCGWVAASRCAVATIDTACDEFDPLGDIGARQVRFASGPVQNSGAPKTVSSIPKAFCSDTSRSLCDALGYVT